RTTGTPIGLWCLVRALRRGLVVGQFHWFDFAKGKKEAMPWLAQNPQVAPRVVVQNDGQMRLSLVIGLDGFDRGDLTSKGEIHNVGPGLRPKPNLVARSKLDAEHANALLSLRPFQVVEIDFEHKRFSSSFRSSQRLSSRELSRANASDVTAKAPRFVR